MLMMLHMLNYSSIYAYVNAANQPANQNHHANLSHIVTQNHHVVQIHRANQNHNTIQNHRADHVGLLRPGHHHNVNIHFLLLYTINQDIDHRADQNLRDLLLY